MKDGRSELLFLSTSHPYPLNCGWNLRILNILQACADAFEVTLVSPRSSDPEADGRLTRLCRTIVHVQPGETAPGALELLRAAVAHRTLSSRETLTDVMPYAAALRSLELDRFALIWAGQPWLALAAKRQRRKTVVDLVDVEHLKLLRQARVQPLRPARLARKMARLFWIEVFALRAFRACVVSSGPERAYLQKLGVRNAVTVPNAVQVQARSVSRRQDPRSACRLVFVGNMAYGPNIDAVAYFSREILPLLSTSLPGVTFDVIGANPSESLRRELPAEVRLRGYVESLPTALADYDIYVAPLRAGGGTKFKVLTALGHGMPLVTTPIGAAGLGLVHGEHALIASTPREIAGAIAALHSSPEEATRLAEAGRSHVEQRFAWDDVRARTADWLVRLAADPRAAR